MTYKALLIKTVCSQTKMTDLSVEQNRNSDAFPNKYSNFVYDKFSM